VAFHVDATMPFKNQYYIHIYNRSETLGNFPL